ncbi:MAG: transglutaminase-like domain-containing protein [Bacteroidales bacterium]|nr:transglutaminase-like domain-containing protein [Bacteroidales bacterium]
MKSRELSALIKLLDDTDTIVFSAVQEKLLNADEKIIPDLEVAVSLSNDDLFIDRTISIINSLRRSKLDIELASWINNKDNDILFGSYLIAKYKYPNLIFEDIEDKLIKIINDIRSEINFFSLTSLQQIRNINNLLFSVQRFKGGFSNIINPDNSYINKVLERKKSNDITISIIYLFITQKLNLPVYGIDFPGNFLLVFLDEQNKEPVFYINPINKGAIVTKKDIDVFLKNRKIKSGNKRLKPCSNKVVLKRLLKFLMHSYLKKSDADNLDDIKHLIKLFEN